jgi:hypothetical protein
MHGVDLQRANECTYYLVGYKGRTKVPDTTSKWAFVSFGKRQSNHNLSISFTNYQVVQDTKTSPLSIKYLSQHVQQRIRP